jgi:hypothetical protein
MVMRMFRPDEEEEEEEEEEEMTLKETFFCSWYNSQTNMVMCLRTAHFLLNNVMVYY